MSIISLLSQDKNILLWTHMPKSSLHLSERCKIEINVYNTSDGIALQYSGYSRFTKRELYNQKMVTVTSSVLAFNMCYFKS